MCVTWSLSQHVEKYMCLLLTVNFCVSVPTVVKVKNRKYFYNRFRYKRNIVLYIHTSEERKSGTGPYKVRVGLYTYFSNAFFVLHTYLICRKFSLLLTKILLWVIKVYIYFLIPLSFLTLQKTVVTICTICFNIQYLHFAHRVYLRDVYDLSE